MNPHPEGYLVKLVRDNVGEALGGDGTVTYRPMPEHEHIKRLRAKLVEEAIEYLQDPSQDELSHVLLVMRALVQVDLGTTWNEIEAQAGVEADERGGFSFGVGMYAFHPIDEVA